FMLLIATMVFSTTTFARQYIQCSTTDIQASDVMVVNLQTEQGGTLMVSPGMQTGEYLLVDIAFSHEEEGKTFYKVINENGIGYVSVPTEILGQSTNFLISELHFANHSAEFSCFARIYEDEN